MCAVELHQQQGAGMNEELIPQCVAIVQRYRNVFGFVSRAMVEDAYARKRLLVAFDTTDQRVVGWLRFGVLAQHATISLVCVEQPQCGVGTKLLNGLIQTLRSYFPGPFRIIVKCPVDEPANAFYAKRGFVQIAQIDEKRRRLNVWERIIIPVDLPS
jgi:GNAT superfamily N-acetyltransferase